MQDAGNGRLINLGFPDAKPEDGILIWGDSHAMVLLLLMDALGKEYGVHVTGAVRYGLPPLVGRISPRPDAALFSDAVMRLVLTQKIRRVVLIAAWSKYTNDGREFESSMRKTIGQLAAAGVNVHVVQDVPTHPYPIPKALVARCMFGIPTRVGSTRAAYIQTMTSFAHQLDKAGVPLSARLDPAPCFVSADDYLKVEQDGLSLYVDSQHLSRTGALLLRPLFEPIFSEIAVRAADNGAGK